MYTGTIIGTSVSNNFDIYIEDLNFELGSKLNANSFAIAILRKLIR